MRFILPLLISILSFASEFPEVFSSTGDSVYSNMQRYSKMITVYGNNSEFLEAYCLDANSTMQKGFSLDKMKNDPEIDLDKDVLKSYIQELRTLSEQNENILSQLDEDIGEMYEKGDFKSLKVVSEAGFGLSDKILQGIKNYKNTTQAVGSNSSSKTQVKTKKATVATQVTKVAPVVTEVKSLPKVKPRNKKSAKLQYYEKSLVSLKSELYELRESQDIQKTACLNDITAINYWMIKVLVNPKDPCARGDAIKQMKSYAKASANSCGRDSLRYVEWKNRIKPYVGTKLFEAEAGCHR